MTTKITFDALRKKVEAENGLTVTTMEVLRDAYGKGKLGVHVRSAIHGQLLANGMGHLPDELPTYQENEVRLYRLGTPMADTINAVLHPTEQGDEVLRQSVGTTAQETLKQIRELVCG